MSIGRFLKYKLILVIVVFIMNPDLQAQTGNGNGNGNDNGNGGGTGAFTVTTVIGKDILNFGTFTSGTSLGEITVDTDGSYNPPPTGGIQTLPFGQAPSAVSFSVNSPNNSKLVTISPTTTVLTGPGGNLTLDLIFSPSSFLTNGGETIVNMGGKLQVPAGISEGSYSGDLLITFSYN